MAKIGAMQPDRLRRFASGIGKRFVVPAVLSAGLLFFLMHGNRSSLAPAARAQETDVSPRPDPEGIAFFEQRIRPVLVERCYDCHASDQPKGGLRLDSRQGARQGGDSGPAVVAGDPDGSLLLRAIAYNGDFHDMPPDGRLPAQTIADFRRWIELGAPDPRTALVPAAKAPEVVVPDPAEHWAFKPVREHTPPQVKDESWPRDEIDRFVLARLDEAGLTPASDADPYTLLRRVYFDLTGLPPTPADTQAFVDDASDDAYERVVDRLLASPAFGDHWARHWLDLSCYADLGDVDGNIVIRDAWRYRDYVIDALNADRPLDQFILEQIAGDLLPADAIEQRRERIIATGFLAIGPWTLQNYIKGQLQADVVDHQIDKIGRTFLGMTLSCARCHDHKFDPVPTRDYYALAGIFHSTATIRHDGPGVWSAITRGQLPESPEEIQAREREAERHTATIAQLKEQQTALEQEREGLRAELARLRGESGTPATSANALTLENAIAANEDGATYHVTFDAAPTLWGTPGQGGLEHDGLRVEILRPDGTILASRVHRPGVWTATSDSQTFRSGAFTYTGDGTGQVTVRIAPAAVGEGRFGGAIDNLRISSDEFDILREDFSGYATVVPAGSQLHTGLRVHHSGAIPGWRGEGINHSHAVEVAPGDFAIQFYSGDRVAPESIPPQNEQQRTIHDRIVQIAAELGPIPGRIVTLEYNPPEPPHALAVSDVDSPADSPIYIRGNFQSHGAIVPRGFLTAVSAQGDSDDGDDFAISRHTSGRLELARWLVRPDHPLTPRVLANRIWRHLIGAGLVEGVDYFGIPGQAPSHPQLLDHLADRLIEDGWSLKRMIRSIVLSRTYRMASDHNPQAWSIDPDNRLLWRMNRRRLEAESIRDAMLAVSGRLDPGRGGPSLGLDIPGNVAGIGGNVNPPSWTGARFPDHVVNRRAIYLPLPRRMPDGPLEILSIFDFPHPSDITGARPQRTVATQALFLLNAPFVKDSARALALRLLSAEPTDDAARVRLLYLLTTGRPAAPAQIEQALSFIKGFDESAPADAASSDPREDAWTELSHALLASSSFLFRE